MKLSVSFNENENFKANFSQGEIFDTSFGEVIRVEDGATIYTGPYTATPKAEASVVLETKDKKLLSNVTVEKVPYWETSNDYGTTAFIAASTIDY